MRVHWQPYDEFETFHLAHSKSIKQIKQMWQALIESPETDAKILMGHWCFALSYHDPTTTRPDHDPTMTLVYPEVCWNGDRRS